MRYVATEPGDWLIAVYGIDEIGCGLVLWRRVPPPLLAPPAPSTVVVTLGRRLQSLASSAAADGSNCTPPDSFTDIQFDNAQLVRSNLGGQGGRCETSAGMCTELQVIAPRAASPSPTLSTLPPPLSLSHSHPLISTPSECNHSSRNLHRGRWNHASERDD